MLLKECTDKRLHHYSGRGSNRYKPNIKLIYVYCQIILFLQSLTLITETYSQVMTFSGFVNEGDFNEHYIYVSKGANVTFLLEWSKTADLDLRVYTPSGTYLVGWEGKLYSCNFSKSKVNNTIIAYTGFCSRPERIVIINSPEEGLWKLVVYAYKGSSNYLLKAYLRKKIYEKRIKTLWSPSLWEVIYGNITASGSEVIIEGKGKICSIERYSSGEFNVKLKVMRVRGAEYILSLGLPEEEHIEIARIVPYDDTLKVTVGIYKEGEEKWSYSFYIDNPEVFHTYKALWNERGFKVYVDNNLSISYFSKRLLSDINDVRICIMANLGKVIVKEVNTLSYSKGIIEERGIIRNDEEKEFTIDVGADVRTLKVHLNWENRGNDLDLYLVTPTGDRIGWGGVFSRGGEGFFKGMRIKYTSFLSKPEYIEVNKPIKGRWKVVISGKDIKVLEVYRLVIERR